MKPSKMVMTMTVLALACAGCAAIGDAEDPELEETMFAAENGIQLDNGLVLGNGALLPNGTKLSNGVKLSNGIDASNGIKLSNGTKLSNGITGPYYAPPAGSGLEQWIDVDPPMRKRILRYLIECALPSPVEVQILYRGQLEVLGRGVGNLGPGLQQGEMGTAEQQKVSACLLARVNARGELVTIDMSGPMGVNQFDQASDADNPFVFEEAAFFGNLFLDQPLAYACQGLDSVFIGAACVDRSCTLGDDGACSCGVMSYMGSCDTGFAGLQGCQSGSAGYYVRCDPGNGEWAYPMTTHLVP
jgi:hypothetical protein